MACCAPLGVTALASTLPSIENIIKTITRQPHSFASFVIPILYNLRGARICIITIYYV